MKILRLSENSEGANLIMNILGPSDMYKVSITFANHTREEASEALPFFRTIFMQSKTSA